MIIPVIGTPPVRPVRDHQLDLTFIGIRHGERM